MDPDIPYLPLRIAVLVATFCLSGFFSGSETALFSYQPDQLERMGRHGGVDGVIAALRERPRRLLITILFCNMFVNVVFYSVSFTMLYRLRYQMGPTGQVLLGVGALLTVMLGGEVAPKNLAYTFYRPFSRAVAYPMLVVQSVLGPITAPFIWLAELIGARVARGAGPSVRPGELHTLVHMGAREGVLDASDSEMIAGVIGRADVRVGELMVPRVDMVSFDAGGSPAELLDLFRSTKLTMVPLHEGRADNVLGLVHVKDVLLAPADATLTTLAQPVPFIPQSATLEEGLGECRRNGAKTAFVVNEYGELVGLVTVEDLAEEIVGELVDEYDVEGRGEVEDLGDGRVRVRASMGLRRWGELSGMNVSAAPGIDTVGGFVTALLGHVPRAGDSARGEGFEFTVESVDARRAEWILARRRGPRGPGGKGAADGA